MDEGPDRITQQSGPSFDTNGRSRRASSESYHMKDGDLSNRVSPYLYIVFEGAVGYCNDAKRHAKFMAKGRADKALQSWDLNELVVRRLLWLYYNKSININCVTFMGNDFGVELNYWLMDEIPFHRVYSTTPEHLGRQVAYMPDLFCIYDPEPERWLMYGAKGRFLNSVGMIGEGL